MARRKVYNVDFNYIEKADYRYLSNLQKEIVDKMVELSTGKKPEMSAEQLARLDLVTAAMDEITDRQKEVLNLLFGLGGEEAMSEVQVAKKLGITKQGVSELKKRALNAIKAKIVLNEDVVKKVKKK